jgi:hypothetical protein
MLQPRIKKRWDTLLRTQPVASPLASPDTLVFLMNQTLSQLSAAGRNRSLKSWLRRNPTLLAPLRSQCDCGTNPLLAYYSTGLLALREVAQPVLGAAYEEVSVYYHGLAQRDIEALCGLCRHNSTDHCPQRQIALEAAAPR